MRGKGELRAFLSFGVGAMGMRKWTQESFYVFPEEKKEQSEVRNFEKVKEE